MFRSKIFFGVSVILLLAIAGMGAQYGWEKFLYFNTRIDSVELRVEHMGRALGIELSRHQKTRGDATFSAPNTPSPFDGRGEWELIGGNGVNGSWSFETERTKALEAFEGRLYVGTQTPGSVWAWDGARWDQVGGNGAYGSWEGTAPVPVLKSFGGRLFAGVQNGSAEVWAFDGDQWELVESWDGGLPIPYSMTESNGSLFVGFQSGADRGPAAIFQFDGNNWTEISEAWIEEYRSVYELWPHNGFLYAGMSPRDPLSDAHVWRYDGAAWAKVGGDGQLGSWTNDSLLLITAFASFQGKLIAALTRYPTVRGEFSSIWALGEDWQPIHATRLPDEFTEIHSRNALLVYRDHLYVGAGGYPSGHAGVWEYQDSGWRKIGGHGVPGSWSQESFSFPNKQEYVYRLLEYDGALIVGFGSGPGQAQVWRYTPAEIPGR